MMDDRKRLAVLPTSTATSVKSLVNEMNVEWIGDQELPSGRGRQNRQNLQDVTNGGRLRGSCAATGGMVSAYGPH